jgi:hypothetical protein
MLFQVKYEHTARDEAGYDAFNQPIIVLTGFHTAVALNMKAMEDGRFSSTPKFSAQNYYSKRL